EINDPSLIKKFYSVCKLLGFEHFLIKALGGNSVIRDRAYFVGWKGIKRVGMKAPTFIELLRKLKNKFKTPIF
ncbi:hypothetical protein ACQJ7R_01630, partial [Helicobacter pylori]